MELKRNGSQPSQKGPDDYFTGNVPIDSPFQAATPGRAGGAIVTFEPGARTAWHRHPLGQTLIVTSGCGWVQSEGHREWKFDQAISSGVRQTRGIGMGQRQPLR